MSFSLSLLLIPYGSVLLIFALMSLVYLYHLLRYGAGHMGTYIFIVFYGIAAFTIISVSWGYGATLPWSSVVEFTPHNGV